MAGDILPFLQSKYPKTRGPLKNNGKTASVYSPTWVIVSFADFSPMLINDN